ncbi:DUF4382 domain-containing protein [Chloroflexota bacterium]
MKKYLMILPLLALVLAGLACGGSDDEGEPTAADIGSLTLNMTDAPVDAGDIAGVYISVTKVEIGDKASGEVEWVELADYSAAPKQLNLLDYTGGLIYEIGQFDIEAGTYNQIRFYLDAPEEGQTAPTNPGCYIEFTDESTEPLFVPSGSNSGYKAVGAFEINEDGDTEVTVDFDARKSIHVTGGGQNQRYILKPTLRLIVDSQAGHIGGSITNGSEYSDITVYAYQAGEYVDTEDDDPAEGQARFANAITSCRMGEDGNYKLAFLGNGNYDLIVVGHNGEAYGEVLGIMNTIQVQNQQQTNHPIDTDDLEDTGTLSLNMTDAPIDAGTVAGVYISITRVDIGVQSPGETEEVEWVELANYSDDPVQINLLDYTEGLAYEIGEFDIEAGQYNQIRFYLDAPEEGEGAPTSPGCYIEFTDPEADDAPLFVPSGSNSGYKAVGSFEVPENGNVEVTVDFDVRKSVHVTGSGQGEADPHYILKPTLRLIVDSEAGNITGIVNDESGLIDIHPFVAYAYEEGDWEADEYNTPDADGNYFTNAVTSANVDAETGEFTLAYLAQDEDYIVVIVVFNVEDGTINEIPIVVDDNADIQPLDQNTVDLGTLNAADYEVIIPGQ